MAAELCQDCTYWEGWPECIRWQLYEIEPFGWAYGDGIGSWRDAEAGDGRGEGQ